MWRVPATQGLPACRHSVQGQRLLQERLQIEFQGFVLEEFKQFVVEFLFEWRQFWQWELGQWGLGLGRVKLIRGFILRLILLDVDEFRFNILQRRLNRRALTSTEWRRRMAAQPTGRSANGDGLRRYRPLDQMIQQRHQHHLH